ncbi:MAG: hypothetical protein M3R43_08435, partial [Acidobacteriota bacterium]|nr:hypothetical protein [Acidobacteriota bacterium]
HPGEYLREEFLVPLGMSANALAMRLARCFGTSAQFWLNLQSMHDLSKAQQESGARVEHEVEPLRMSAAE